MTIVQPYNKILDGDKKCVGGKAWAVGKLAQAGIPVPNGFCVTSEFVSIILKSDAAFEKAYESYLESVDKTGVSDQVLANQVKSRIERQHIGPDELSEFSTALDDYIRITAPNIIVRSSADVEDSAKASFAGQFASRIAKNNCGELVEAMKKCWQVITSPSLAAYAFAMKISLSRISFAFLVQEFLEFDHSGVLFTRSPVKGDLGDYLIEYSKGGAEKVVSGRVTPNQCLLKEGNKAVEWLRHSTESEHPKEDVLLQLGQLATKAKTLFRSEQDIEWGIVGSEVFLLQSRPLTASIK